MAPEQIGGGRPEELSDHALWHLSRNTDASDDEIERLLDLAGYAEGQLDDDERERIAALIEMDESAATDLAAARHLSGQVGLLDRAVPAAIIANACALQPAPTPQTARVIPFPIGRRLGIGWNGVAQWASLAAAMLVASWLGFTLGFDASLDYNQLGQTDDSALLRDLLDPPTGLLRDVTEGIQT